MKASCSATPGSRSPKLVWILQFDIMKNILPHNDLSKSKHNKSSCVSCAPHLVLSYKFVQTFGSFVYRNSSYLHLDPPFPRKEVISTNFTSDEPLLKCRKAVWHDRCGFVYVSRKSTYWYVFAGIFAIYTNTYNIHYKMT